jgi:hypothetical protein
MRDGGIPLIDGVTPRQIVESDADEWTRQLNYRRKEKRRKF